MKRKVEISAEEMEKRAYGWLEISDLGKIRLPSELIHDYKLEVGEWFQIQTINQPIGKAIVLLWKVPETGPGSEVYPWGGFLFPDETVMILLPFMLSLNLFPGDKLLVMKKTQIAAIDIIPFWASGVFYDIAKKSSNIPTFTCQ